MFRIVNTSAMNSAGYMTANCFPGFGGWAFPSDPNQEKYELAVIPKQAKVKVGHSEGYECSSCKDFYPMAELNQPDNVKEFKIFTCYGCRKGISSYFKNQP